MPLDNFGLAWRGPAGKHLYRAAQPDLRGLYDLAALGVSTVFKLNDGDADNSFPGLVVKTPLAGWSLWYDTDKIIEICARIHDTLQGSSVLVHCQKGRDRTGLCCAAFRLIYDDATLEEVQKDRADFGVTGVIALVDSPENQTLNAILSRRGK